MSERDVPLYYREKCAACGIARWYHHGSQPEWCPAHAGRMDWMMTTIFKSSGETLSNSAVKEKL